MMTGPRGQSIAVMTMTPDIEAGGLERWFAGAVDALIGAVALGSVGPWRLAAGIVPGHSPVDPAMLADFADRARSAGGEFESFTFQARIGTPEDYAQVLATRSDDLVLVLDRRAVIVGSTVDRMVRSLSATIDAVAARQLPLEKNEGVCVLFTRGAIDDGRLGQPERVKTTPHCTVFLDEEPSTVSHGGGSNGSLLEEAVSLTGAISAEAGLAAALNAPVAPLVSVVMRTQGLRLEPLRDVLLCLAGQSDGRFELILVVHDADTNIVRRVLDDQPTWLRSRTRTVSAIGGSRSRPLNVGIEAASGSLVAFLDDDDLVLASWVSSFLDAAVRYPHSLLRAWSGVQRVATTEWPGDIEGHRDESAMTTPYPETFDLADHLRVNMSPFMSFAFPIRFFSLLGGADESLEVCEDWDLVLRGASVLGVGDVPRLTSIYRRWNSGRDSYSLHEPAIWERDMKRVRAKLDARPLLLPSGAATELAGLSAARAAKAELAAVHRSSSWRITAPLRAISARLGDRRPGRRRRPVADQGQGPEPAAW